MTLNKSLIDLPIMAESSVKRDTNQTNKNRKPDSPLRPNKKAKAKKVDEPDAKLQKPPPQLPNELISRIILELQKEQKYQVLAQMALASQEMYDLVIPKLYETIIVTEHSQRKLLYGHYDGKADDGSILITTRADPVTNYDFEEVSDSGFEDLPESETLYHTSHAIDGNATRKDLAVKYCRRLIFDSAIHHPNFKKAIGLTGPARGHARYANIDEIIVSAKCLQQSVIEVENFEDDMYVDQRSLVSVLKHFDPFASCPKKKRIVFHLSTPSPGTTSRAHELLTTIAFHYSTDHRPTYLNKYEFFDVPFIPSQGNSGYCRVDAIIHIDKALRKLSHVDMSHLELFIAAGFALEIRKKDAYIHRLSFVNVHNLFAESVEGPSQGETPETFALKVKAALAKHMEYCDVPLEEMMERIDFLEGVDEEEEYPWWPPAHAVSAYPVEDAGDGE